MWSCCLSYLSKENKYMIANWWHIAFISLSQVLGLSQYCGSNLGISIKYETDNYLKISQTLHNLTYTCLILQFIILSLHHKQLFHKRHFYSHLLFVMICQEISVYKFIWHTYFSFKVIIDTTVTKWIGYRVTLPPRI